MRITSKKGRGGLTGGLLVAVSWAGAIVAQPLSAQDMAQADGLFRRNNSGLDEAIFAETDLRLSPGEDDKRVRVSVRKLRVDNARDGAEMLDLPERGYVFLQHKAGDVEVVAGKIRYEPYEGEWMTIPLPQRIVFVTEDDAALLDAIIFATE